MAPRSGPDDRSSHLHRQVIGWLGLGLPLLVVVFNHWRPDPEIPPRLLTSISAYHFTEGVPAFAGILAALSVFLLTYRGYGNAWQRQDRVAAVVAGVAAAGVALFPTEPPVARASTAWWTVGIGVVHYVSATVLFSAFIFFALVLFPKTAPGAPPPTPDKIWRNRLYRACGVAMIGCLVWIAVASYFERTIFWPEALLLWVFAASWLIKGRTDETIKEVPAAVHRFVARYLSR